jgi:hypothetical protein
LHPQKFDKVNERIQKEEKMALSVRTGTHRDG